MAHIAMFGVDAVSHTLPSLEILRELVARGHRVSVVNDPHQRELVEDTGAQLVPCTSTLPEGDWPDDPIAAMRIFLEDAVQGLEQVREHFTADPADLYLADIGGYGGRVLAEAQGAPFVQLSPTYVAWEGYAQEVGDQIMALPGAAEYRADFATWLERSGATTHDPDAFAGTPPRALALVPRAMQPHADRVDERRISFVGPCIGERADQGSWQRPDGAEVVVLVSLGSSYTDQPDFYRECVAAFGGRPGWHLVLQVGRRVDIDVLGALPDGVEVHRWVPQLAILREADLFVTHAGMGGSGEGLLTATPMIAVPQDVDQFANADTLVGLGVARRIDTADATAEALRTAGDELLADRDVAARLAELAHQTRAEGGTSRAADLVEAELR
ncbi:glycosyl transferase [Janibacter indicus]|uniref:Glycosyl transferase n=1 Tax=Janibacter indicus TaxID=857417 RepID=A0A1L3MID7_9MICO|nr:macrolide family glycosyltransferase [Janibacter indicus]APH01914.1 glycosyl transferase [Janibacter indicus]